MLECLAAHHDLTAPDATGMRFGILDCHKCSYADRRLCESILDCVARKVSMHEKTIAFSTARIAREVVL